MLEETEKLLLGCSCEISCYHCLRHYENNFLHKSLDRHLALSLLNYLKYGTVPILSAAEKQNALVPMVDLLRLKQVEVETGENRHGFSVPLILKKKGGAEVWIDIHHPMTSPPSIETEISKLAKKKSNKFVFIDSYSLVHDLPASYSQIIGV